MARRVKRNKVRRHSRRRHSRRTNPVAMAAPRRRRRSAVGRRRARAVSRRRTRRSNPSVGRMTGLFTQGLAAIGGAVGSRALTQAVLGSSNTSWMGYAGNVVATFALGKVVGMLFKDKSIERAAMIGGFASLAARIVGDKTPYGQKLSLTGMGDYMTQGFLAPQILVDPLNSAQVSYPQQLRPSNVVPMAAGMKGYSLGKSAL